MIKLPNPIHLPVNAEIDPDGKESLQVIRISRTTVVSNNLPVARGIFTRSHEPDGTAYKEPANRK